MYDVYVISFLESSSYARVPRRIGYMNIIIIIIIHTANVNNNNNKIFNNSSPRFFRFLRWKQKDAELLFYIYIYDT